MRSDDRIDTILAWPVICDADRARVWRQLADLFHLAASSSAGPAAVLRRMRECEAAVGQDERQRLARVGTVPETGAHSPDLAPHPVIRKEPDEPPAPAETTSQIVDLLARLEAFQANRGDTTVEGTLPPDQSLPVPVASPTVPAQSVAVTGHDILGRTIDLLRGPLHKVPHLLSPETLPTGELRAAAALVADRSIALADALDALELAVAMAGDAGLDSGALLARLDAALQPLAETRGLRISFRVASGLPAVDADAQSVERMVTRLVGAIVSLARRGEHVVARLGRDRSDGRMLALSITRPGRLLGRNENALFHPPARADQADAPELGLSFALRLIDRLARETGGRLTIHDDRIVLALPLRTDRTLRDLTAG